MLKIGAKDILYRLWRLRRLEALVIVLPLPALALAIWAGVAVGWWLVPIWALAVLAHAVIFPNASVELMGLGLTLTLILLISPLAGLAVRPLFGYPLAVVIGFLLWMSVSVRLHLLERFPSPFKTFDIKRRLSVDPETARRALFLRPDAQVGYFRCGPADAGGVFEVTVTDMPTPAPIVPEHLLDEAEDDETENEDWDDAPSGFLARVVSSDAGRQDTIVIADFSRDDPDVVTTVQTVKEVRGGTVYAKREQVGAMGLVSGLGFWLTDADADFVVAHVDRTLERPSLAIRAAHGDTPFTMAARWIISRRVSAGAA